MVRRNEKHSKNKTEDKTEKNPYKNKNGGNLSVINWVFFSFFNDLVEMCLADSTRTRLYANNDKATQNKTASAVYQLDDKNRREKRASVSPYSDWQV